MEQVKVYGKYYDTLSTMIKKKCMNTTLTKIGQESCLTVSYLSDIKSGRRIPSTDNTLLLLANVFELPLELVKDICEVERIYSKMKTLKSRLKHLETKHIKKSK